jgi:predicted MFS family arabinose efflux permease
MTSYQPAPSPPSSPLILGSPSTEVPTLTNTELALVTGARLAMTTAYRVIYPLLPFLSQRLDVNLQTVSALVTVQMIASLISPIGGALADTRGPRTTMSLGLAVFCVGALLCAALSTFSGFLAGYLLIGLAAALYQPAAQAYVSARTPYTRRGWALGVYETSWAGAAILGVTPLMFLVERTNDSAPVFWALLGVGIGSLALIRLALPSTPMAVGDGAASRRIEWGALRMPRVLGMLGLLTLSLAAVDLVFVIHGAWLKTDFGASEAQLGQAFGVLGIAELVGAVGSTLLVDRVGKKRAVVFGFLATAAGLALLPFSDGNWLLFLTLFFLFGVCFEFAIVAAFPLASGIAPGIRGTVMALSVTSTGLGRTLGSLLSEPIWRTYGIGANGLLAAALTIVGVVVCLRFVHETET